VNGERRAAVLGQLELFRALAEENHREQQVQTTPPGRVVQDMPKTRSGKIMRRVIAGISNFSDVGDTSTLANPEIVDAIREQVQREKDARGEVPKDLSQKEKEEIATFAQASE